jgi:hypothetical protein
MNSEVGQVDRPAEELPFFEVGQVDRPAEELPFFEDSVVH